MNNDFIDIKSLKLRSPDSLSKTLTSLLISLSKVKRLNKLANSIQAPLSNPKFLSEFLKSRSINVKTSNIDFPTEGPCIISLPISFGILDFIISYASVFENTQRSDIKLLTTNQHFATIPSISSYFLDVKSFNITSVFKASVNHLNKGGVLIYLNRTPASCSCFSTEFKYPIRLANITNAPFYALKIESDSTTALSKLSVINSWFNVFFSVRALLSQKNSNVLLSSSGLITDKCNFDCFYSDNI